MPKATEPKQNVMQGRTGEMGMHRIVAGDQERTKTISHLLYGSPKNAQAS